MDLAEKNKNSTFRHPWEISRAHFVLQFIKNNPISTQYVDIGAGDLFFTKKLTNYTNKPVYAIDLNYKSLYQTNKIILLKNVADMPRNTANCIILMDVLEHIQNENLFLKKILEILKPGKQIIITVPAYQFLFSPHDIFLKHYRRYNKKRLTTLLRKHGLEVKYVSYFYSSLFLIRLVQIVLLKLKVSLQMDKGVGNWNQKQDSIITKVMTSVLNIDCFVNKFINRFGITLPGLSLCAVCNKKSV